MTTTSGIVPPDAGLTDTERQAVDLAHDIYLTVRHAPVLDDKRHWERFTARLKSAAYAHSAPAFVSQLAQRFGVPHVHGDEVVRLLNMPAGEARDVMRVLRQETPAVTSLVRHHRDTTRRSAA